MSWVVVVSLFIVFGRVVAQSRGSEYDGAITATWESLVRTLDVLRIRAVRPAAMVPALTTDEADGLV